MPEVVQKLIEDFSFLISTVVPKLLKNFLTLILGGQIGTGPFFNEIGGRGIALTTVALTLIAFFNFAKLMVDIKLITVWFDLNFKFLIIFSPILGVTDKKTQLHEFTISWLLFAICTFLNFFSNFLAIILLREEIIILVYDIFELQIPSITDDAILPVPIKPNFIFILYQ